MYLKKANIKLLKNNKYIDYNDYNDYNDYFIIINFYIII